MKELEYPFDSKFINQNIRKIKKSLLSQGEIKIKKRIAVLGGSTTANIIKTLELFLLNQGIIPEFYESEYNKYFEDAVFPNADLEAFSPDVVYIHTSNRNILTYPTLSDSNDVIELLISNEMGRFENIWSSLFEKYNCTIIQNNFEMPMYRLLGNKDASDIHGAVNFLARLNMKFYDYAQEHKNFYICDINYISADYGLREWADPFYWHMYKYALNVNAIPYLSFNVSNIIKSLFGKNKKGFVLDLDNTLWGGVIGDDGVDNIKIGPEESTGQVYTEFQQYIKAHKQLGVVLAVDSKNEAVNAISGLNHPDSLLKPDDFVEIVANWEPKDKNFLKIAKDISLLPESLVFLDDNPAERFIITEQIKGVAAPDIGESHQYIINVDRSGFFETTVLSEDDINRNEMYRNNVERMRLQSSFTDYGEYLDSLQMSAVINAFEDVYLERIIQLINKSNQFNLTTKRYSQSEIRAVAGNDNYITLYGKLEDKFGDNGIVSVVIGRVVDDVCHIELWLMSCRVLKRDMEFAMMDSLVGQCKRRRIGKLIGCYYPTSKNSMVKDFYKDMGFVLDSENSGITVWSLNIPVGYQNLNRHIKIKNRME